VITNFFRMKSSTSYTPVGEFSYHYYHRWPDLALSDRTLLILYRRNHPLASRTATPCRSPSRQRKWLELSPVFWRFSGTCGGGGYNRIKHRPS
jgi:hypothetical protein